MVKPLPELESTRFADSLRVDEIFLSIQGEGLDTGKPCVFVRLYGCSVGCVYCDQPQKYEDSKWLSIQAVISAINKFKCPNVCITGGEPLLQDNVYPLIYELVSDDFNVSIETSGCVPIDADYYNRKFKYVMDVKCPSSKVCRKNELNNLIGLQPIDEVKFVIADRKDYEYAKKVMLKYSISATILFSPCFNQDGNPMISKDLVDWILEDRLFNVRIQYQMHKVLGVK